MVKSLVSSAVPRRSFYPSSLAPTTVEIRDQKRRSSKWSREQKDTSQRLRKYRLACRMLATHQPFKTPLIAAGGVAGVVLLGVTALAGPVTKAFLNGLLSADGGTQLIPGAWGGLTFLGVQAAGTVAWMVSLKQRQTINRCELQVLQYQEWTRSVTCKDKDIQETCLCFYKEHSPFDPTHPEIEVVLGECYENEGQKLGEAARYYTIPF